MSVQSRACPGIVQASLHPELPLGVPSRSFVQSSLQALGRRLYRPPISISLWRRLFCRCSSILTYIYPKIPMFGMGSWSFFPWSIPMSRLTPIYMTLQWLWHFSQLLLGLARLLYSEHHSGTLLELYQNSETRWHRT